jgi:hypothetical protein
MKPQERKNHQRRSAILIQKWVRGHIARLAIDGRCKTLDADADGYVRGEACGVLLLDGEGKSLDTEGHVIALRDLL